MFGVYLYIYNNTVIIVYIYIYDVILYKIYVSWSSTLLLTMFLRPCPIYPMQLPSLCTTGSGNKSGDAQRVARCRGGGRHRAGTSIFLLEVSPPKKLGGEEEGLCS